MKKNESKYFLTASYMDDALLELLAKKDFEYITVTEICKKAGVNRTTFYLHYESMDDLLQETIERVFKTFQNSFNVDDKQDHTNIVLTRKEYLLPYLTFIEDNLKIYKLMHEKMYLFGLKKITAYLYKTIFTKALSNFGVKESEKDYIFSFYINGVIGIINKWIENNCEDDKEKVIHLIETLTQSK